VRKKELIKRFSEEEIDEIVIRQANDPSAWGKPVHVKPTARKALAGHKPIRVNPRHRYVLCLQSDYVDLEAWKVYRRLHEDKGEKDGLIRVIDESGEDYLYPARWFTPIFVFRTAKRMHSSTTKKRKSSKLIAA
jgi:hypothetical protein